MKRVISYLLICMFVLTAVVADDGCCDSKESPSASSVQISDQAQDTADTDSKSCDCTSCFNCVRCGGAASVEVQYFSFSDVEGGLIYGFYTLSNAPSPYLSGLKRPPIS